jgi:hypothetical protein
VAAHLGSPLQLAVDPAVALLELAGVPGNVEVDQMLAVVLQVHPLPGGIGGDQDPQRLFIGIGIELGLEPLAVVFTHATGEAGDAAIGVVLGKQDP